MSENESAGEKTEQPTEKRLRDAREQGNLPRSRELGTAAVFGAGANALYFSKEVIPFTSATYADADDTPVFHHVGVYAYRPDALAAYPGWSVGPLEQLEGLEQLRFLENGRRVLCAEVDARGRQFWELNNPEDVPRIEAMMAQMGLD